MKKIFYLLLVLFSATYFAQEKEPFTVFDYLSSTSISQPSFSPDGQWIVFVLGTKKSWDSGRNNDLMLVSFDGSKKIHLTTSEKAEWSPRWSNDGAKIGFLSNRDGAPQVYQINISGGEAEKLTDVKDGISSFCWAGQNKIAYLKTEPRDSVILAAEESAGGGWIVGTKGNTNALWLKSVENGNEEKITDGSYFISSFDCSPDGNVFAMITADNSELYNQMTSPELKVVNRSGKLLFKFSGPTGLGQPDVSDDGIHVAFAGNTIGFSANDGLFVSNIKTGRTVNLTYDFDPTIQEIYWLDNSTISFKTPRNVYSGVYSISLEDALLPDAVNDNYINAEIKEVKTLLSPATVIYGYSFDAATENAVFIGTRKNQPVELFTANVNDGIENAKKLTDYNDWMTKKSLATTKLIKFKSGGGIDIEAVLTLPPDYKEGEKYPLMVLPHGGPDGIVMDRFGFFGQIFANEGFIVYEPNFRGSIGYGRDLYKANRGELGYVDYDDIMNGLDYLIAEGMVDEDKMVVGGWSYGGYMTDWIIGHTDRFKAAVTVAGISNTVSMYAQSDINHGDIARWEFKGVPVFDMKNFTRSSPITFLKNSKTPTLILHGEADDRVPVMQGWEIYRALIDAGVETQMVLYPGANHGIRPPKQFTNVITRWINWYKDHLERNNER